MVPNHGAASKPLRVGILQREHPTTPPPPQQGSCWLCGVGFCWAGNCEQLHLKLQLRERSAGLLPSKPLQAELSSEESVCFARGGGWPGSRFFIDLSILKAYFWGGFIFPPLQHNAFQIDFAAPHASSHKGNCAKGGAPWGGPPHQHPKQRPPGLPGVMGTLWVPPALATAPGSPALLSVFHPALPANHTISTCAD